MLHVPLSAPASALPPERRGEIVGRFCRSCRSVYPLYAERHSGKPAFGRDHVASPCSWEGRAFVADAESLQASGLRLSQQRTEGKTSVSAMARTWFACTPGPKTRIFGIAGAMKARELRDVAESFR